MIVAIDVSSNSAQRAFDLSAAAITGKSTHRLVSGPASVDNNFMSICADTGTIFPLR